MKKKGYSLLQEQVRLLNYELIMNTQGSQNAGIALELKGKVDVEKLNRALIKLGKKIDTFNYKFYKDKDGKILQVKTEKDLKWIKVDINKINCDSKLCRALEMINEENKKPFKIFNEPLFKFYLYELSQNWIILYIKASHILVDAPSFQAIFSKLNQYYYNIDDHEEILQWSEFIEFEEFNRNNEIGDGCKKYWLDRRKNIEDEITAFDLTELKLMTSKNENRVMDKKKLKRIASKYKISIFQVVVCVYNLALAKIFKRDSFAIGYTVTNRFNSGMKFMVGMTTHEIYHSLTNIDTKEYNELISDSKIQTNEGFKNISYSDIMGSRNFKLSFLTNTTKFLNWKGLKTKFYPLQGKNNFNDLTFILMCNETDQSIELEAIRDENVYDSKFFDTLLFYMNQEISNMESGNNRLKYEKIPLTLTQQHYANKEYHESPGFLNLSSGFILRGNYDLDRLNKSIRCLYKRHDALKMIIHLNEDSDFFMTVDDSISRGLDIVELKSINPKDRFTESMKDLEKKASQSLMFKKESMFRFYAYKITENELVFMYIANHLVADGGSIAILNNEIELLYSDPKRKDLDEPGSYKEYMIRKNIMYNSPKFIQSAKYWEKEINLKYNKTNSINLETNSNIKKEIKTMEENSIILDKEKVVKIAKNNKTSNFNIIFILWQFITTILNKQEKMNFRYAFAGRFNKEYKNTIGLLAHGVPVKFKLGLDETWSDLIKRQSKIIIEGLNHVYASDMIFGQEYTMSFITYDGMKERDKFENLKLEKFSKVTEYNTNDFFCYLVVELSDKIVIYPYYNSRFYKQAYALEMGERIKECIEKISDNNNILIKNLYNYKINEEINDQKKDMGYREEQENIECIEYIENINIKNIEKDMKQLWKDVLELERFPKDCESFFELGGNSYKIFYLINNLPKYLEGKLEISDFYEFERFREFIKNVENKYNYSNKKTSN